MKKVCCSCLLIYTLSLCFAQDTSQDSSLENKNTELLQKDSSQNVALLSEIRPAQEEIPSEPVALSELSPFTLQPTPSDPIAPIDFTLPPPQISVPKKYSFLAVGLSSLIPGLGHLYLGDFSTAGTILGSAALGCGAMFVNDTRYGGALTFTVASCYGIYALDSTSDRNIS